MTFPQKPKFAKPIRNYKLEMNNGETTSPKTYYHNSTLEAGSEESYIYSNENNLTFYDATVGSETTLNTLLTGGGSGWTDSGTYLKPNTDGYAIHLYDTGGTKYISLWHDGTDAHILTNTGNLILESGSNIKLNDHLDVNWKSVENVEELYLNTLIAAATNISVIDNMKFTGGSMIALYDSLDNDRLVLAHDGSTGIVQYDDGLQFIYDNGSIINASIATDGTFKVYDDANDSNYISILNDGSSGYIVCENQDLYFQSDANDFMFCRFSGEDDVNVIVGSKPTGGRSSSGKIRVLDPAGNGINHGYTDIRYSDFGNEGTYYPEWNSDFNVCGITGSDEADFYVNISSDRGINVIGHNAGVVIWGQGGDYGNASARYNITTRMNYSNPYHYGEILMGGDSDQLFISAVHDLLLTSIEEDVTCVLGDKLGGKYFRVKDEDLVDQFTISSNGDVWIGDDLNVDDDIDCGGSIDAEGSIWADDDIDCGGTKYFVIDHPLDPENKILRHACIESPEKILMYRGQIECNNEVELIMPEYFWAINEDITIQTTPVNELCLTSYKLDIDNKKITILSNKKCVISYTVYGVRADKHAKTKPFVPEIDKDEPGYLRPDLWNKDISLKYYRKKKKRNNIKKPNKKNNKIYKQIINKQKNGDTNKTKSEKKK